MKKIVLVFIIILLSTVSMLADGVGTWKNYLSYYEPTEIEKGSGNILYVLLISQFSIFTSTIPKAVANKACLPYIYMLFTVLSPVIDLE